MSPSRLEWNDFNCERPTHFSVCECVSGQLNIWGFNRLEDSKKGWRHDYFIRGDVERVALIKRIEIKGRSTTTRQRKRSRRTTTASKESCNSTVPVLPDLAASIGCVSLSESDGIGVRPRFCFLSLGSRLGWRFLFPDRAASSPSEWAPP